MIRVTSFEEESTVLDIGGTVTHYPELEDFYSTSSSALSRSPLSIEVIDNLQSTAQELTKILEEEENVESISSVIEDIKASIITDQEKQVKKETQGEIRRLPEMIQTSPVFDTPITEETLEQALLFISRFFELLRFFRHRLRKPHIATEGTGEVSLGWWYGDKSLTFFINPTGEIEFLKAWGPNIYNDMEEGFNPTDHKLIDLWRWLIQ